MEIRDRLVGNVAVVELTGRLTVNDQPGMLKNAITAMLGRGAVHVLLDLAEVYYIDSTRLGELIGAHITVTRLGGRLKLVRTPQRIAHLIHIAGLTGIFECFESVEEATNSLT
jgi:anti-sigma B factor antagonist